MIGKVLIANRGEIAVRIIRSCRELGIRTVAIFSDADRTAMHVRYADEAYYLGASPSSESYLNQDKILEVAKKSNAEAIHPGYGFLSENAGFAEKVGNLGIIFIGPSPNAISVMGDKISARSKMIEANVPVVPGINVDGMDTNDIINHINSNIGYPVMIKASAGGGGKGMRLAKNDSELDKSIRLAKSEAKAAFGDDTVYIEKYISSPHHIEFQVLADSFGNTVHLGERECSVQRRHQKIIEETPSPLMTQELRNKMGQSAVEAAKSVNYTGAGTIEFLVDDDLNYYFLEMNTRLQVEHPITERITGFDLVKEQILIASGYQLKYSQNEISFRGHSIECRIYAEDPANNFMPSPGVVQKIIEPMGLGVRSDGYVYEGYEIPIYYDPMISKLVIWGSNREEALDRMKRSLEEYFILGVRTNIDFLKRIFDNPVFREGKYNTHFIEENEKFLKEECKSSEKTEDLAMIVAFIEHLNSTKGNEQQLSKTETSAWKLKGRQQLLRSN